MQSYSFHNQQGISLIIVFFVMVILVAAVLSASVFLQGSIKITRNVANSMVSFYAADSGVEKVLYYDRKVTPNDNTALRGLCLMCDQQNQSCPSSGAPDSGMQCNCQASVLPDPGIYPQGCNPSVCNDCTITFSTSIDGISYTTKATVHPAGGTYDMEIFSQGLYNNIGRQNWAGTPGHPGQ